MATPPYSFLNNLLLNLFIYVCNRISIPVDRYHFKFRIDGYIGVILASKLSPEAKKVWIKVKSAWVFRQSAFSHSLALLSVKESTILYDIVKLALFKKSFAEIIHLHPELGEILKSEDDRACMYAVYGVVSWKLGRKEEPPGDMRLAVNTKSRIGRTYKDTTKKF